MNEFIKKLEDARRRVHFAPERKAAVRNYLSRMMEAHTVVAERAGTHRSPFHLQNILARRGMPVFASVLVVVILSSGTSFAAQGALPGDVLYPVKVGITEKIVGAFKASPEAKADYDADLAIRRLDEASALAKRGPLDDATKTSLAGNFVARTKEVKRALLTLQKEKPKQALAIADRFSKELDDRARVLDGEDVMNSMAVSMSLAAPDGTPSLSGTSGQGQEKKEANDVSPAPDPAAASLKAVPPQEASSTAEVRSAPLLPKSTGGVEAPTSSTAPHAEFRTAASQEDGSEKEDVLSGAVRNAGRDFQTIRQELLIEEATRGEQ